MPTKLGTDDRLTLLSVADDEPLSVTLDPKAVRQRNWSRVVRAQATDRAVFLKQSCDTLGRWQADQYRSEASATQALRARLPHHVPVLLARSDEHLVLCYEHHDVRAADDIVRTAGELSGADLMAITETVRALNACLDEWAADPGDLTTKHRAYASGPPTVIPKGTDIRNIGVSGDRPALFFDPGRLYVGPREERDAKWLASVLLLNWGAPLSRYARGPDLGLSARFADAVGVETNREAVLRELRRELRRAVLEPMAGSWSRRRAKSLGSAVLGVPYFLRCARWTRRRWPRSA